MELKNVKEKPKVALVNDQFKGELVGQKSSEDATSFHMTNRKQAHELTTDVRMVNDQVRGELAGACPCPSTRSEWPSLVGVALVLTRTVLACAGQKTNVDGASMHITRSLENGKLVKETRMVNEQIRGASSGMQSNHMAQAGAVSGQ